MTTIVWDTKVLAADTRHWIAKGFIGPDGDKIKTPNHPGVLFEGAQLVAAAGAGEMTLLTVWLAGICASSGTLNTLKQSMQTAPAHLGRQSLLILTVSRCFKIEVEAGNVSHSDVTGMPAAIGSGAKEALPLLEDYGVFTAIARAARTDSARTNNLVTWVNRVSGSTSQCATRKQMKRAGLEETLLRFGIPPRFWKK
ncbi:hypothetical protein [Pseudomonas orientalis]|uniref:hypothetical protein n=1 Tax=Pseudomonas orientalis TaxID=76758 RepID=UPI0034D6FEBB